jgi:hypothetical protein
VKLVVGEDSRNHLAPSEESTQGVLSLPDNPDLELEIDAMLSDLKEANMDLPDEVIQMCAAYMARCTELHVNIVRIEGRNRHLKWLRTQQLSKVMELIEFTYRAASRIVEIRRQDAELSR